MMLFPNLAPKKKQGRFVHITRMGVGATSWSWTPLRSGAAPPAPRGNTTELWPQQKEVSHGALCLWKGLLRALAP